MINKIATAWCIFCVAFIVANEDKVMLQDIQDGDIMAWSRHITGQDVNDPNTHHYFRSVAIVNDNSTRANGDTRTDSVVYVVVDRDEFGTFIEQFQPLDWGDDSDYCWFVDAAIGGADVNSLGRDAIPDTPATPAVPPAQFRDEAYAIAGRLQIVWFDPDYVELSREGVGGDSQLCSTIDHDPVTGAVVAGTGLTEDGCKLVYWDVDGNKDTDKFHPADNWGAATSQWQACTAVRFSANGDYVYAAGYSVSLYYHMYKFDVSTGLDVWTYTDYILHPYSMYVDASDNVYMCLTDGSDQGVVIIDSDGNLTQFHQMYVRLIYGIWVDEANSRIYLVGSSQASAKATISAINIDGTNLKRYNTFVSGSDNLYNVTVVDGEVFAVGSRTNKGYGGAYATVWKFDSDLNVLASYDTGATTTATAIVEDAAGNLVIRITEGSNSPDQIVLDTDLNLVQTFETTLITDLYAGETIVIDYMDDGTPGVPGVPGLIAENKFGTGLSNPVRLIDFVPSTEEPYVIEMGNEYFAFLKSN